jgi:transposase
MLSLPSSTRVFVCRTATDMRCSFDKLSSLTEQVLKQDPLSGHLFVFMNRLRTHLKVLYFDRTGYALWYKRLERGTFTLPPVEEIQYRDLVCILEGLEQRKLRYSRVNMHNSDAQKCVK